MFPDLLVAAKPIVAQYPNSGFRASTKWDPFSFLNFCEKAREAPGSPSERAALEIQRAEWQLLFDYCARSRS